MPHTVFRALAISVLISAWLPALEVTTGFLIGPKYDATAFYVRTGVDAPWQKTYSGSEYRRAAQGKLMGVRLSQALFQDDFLTGEPSFNPAENTNLAIRALDALKAYGVLLVSVNLQGSDPGYRDGGDRTARIDGYRHGPGKGTSVSAYLPDGSLRPEWMARLAQFLKAADQKGMIVKVVLFYQRQDELFDSSDALLNAARNITDWLIRGSHRNVILSIASDWSNSEWDHDSFVSLHLEQLIDAIRDRFQALRTDFALPVAVGTSVRLAETSRLVESADVLMVRGDGVLIDPRKVERPEIVTSLDGASTPENAENLSKDRASCASAFEQRSGWLSRPLTISHRFPFRYEPGEVLWDASLPAEDQPAAYLRSILDCIAHLTLNKPPRTKAGGVK